MGLVRFLTQSNPWFTGGLSQVVAIFGAIALVQGLRTGRMRTGRIPSWGIGFSRSDQPLRYWATIAMMTLIVGLALAVFLLILAVHSGELL
jgi:hypothetical protein